MVVTNNVFVCYYSPHNLHDIHMKKVIILLYSMNHKDLNQVNLKPRNV